MPNRNSIPLRLTDEENQILRQRASQKGVSINKYIENLILEDAKITPAALNDSDSNDKDIVRVQVKLSKSDHQRLIEKAQSSGMNLTEYMRDIANKKSYINLAVGISDLHELIDEINTLSKKLNGTVAILRSSGEIYEQDVQNIISIFKDIDETCNRIYLEERSERYRLYEEAKKHLYETVDGNKNHKSKSVNRKRREAI